MFKYLFYFVVAVKSTESYEWIKEFQVHLQANHIDKPFSFASFYQSHMVLQAEPNQAVVWGYSPEGTVSQTMTLSILEQNKTYTAVISPEQKWSVKMDPIAAGGPYTLKAVLGVEKIVLQDVLFGDVWLCSGQSNMVFYISWMFNATEEIKDAVNYPNIRVFNVKEKESKVPLDDLSQDGIFQPWSLPGTGNFTKFSAVCWLYGKYLYQHMKRPLGLIDTAWGGTPVEAWSSPDALGKCGLSHSYSGNQQQPYNMTIPDLHTPIPVGGPQQSSVLWNAMIHPLLNMSIFGAIWYQGEANVNLHMDSYNCTFPAMINDWRKKFHQSGGTSAFFPFGFVQLAGYRPDRSIKTGFPDIRWHQTADYGYVPNHVMREVFMAVAMDLPDFLSPFGSIHPRYKRDVAHRLVLGSLAVAYKQSVEYQGPFPVHLTMEDWTYGTKINVIYSRPVEEWDFEGFELCCSYVHPPVCHTNKSWWIPALVVFDEGIHNASVSTLLVRDCKRSNIVGVRYAWSESPCMFKNCAIYGKESGLPMPPFTFAGEEFFKIANY